MLLLPEFDKLKNNFHYTQPVLNLIQCSHWDKYSKQNKVYDTGICFRWKVYQRKPFSSVLHSERFLKFDIYM